MKALLARLWAALAPWLCRLGIHDFPDWRRARVPKGTQATLDGIAVISAARRVRICRRCRLREERPI